MCFFAISAISFKFLQTAPDGLFGEFINNISAKNKVAFDLNNETKTFLNKDILFYERSVMELSKHCENTADIIFTSNFLEHLENKVDELIQLCDELKKKYTKIQSDRELWLAERARLMEKNKMVQTKVEAMITRLKAIGQE